MIQSLSPWRRAYLDPPAILRLGDGNPAKEYNNYASHQHEIDTTPEWFAAQTEEEYSRAKHDYWDASRRRNSLHSAEEPKPYKPADAGPLISKAICKGECQQAFKECTDTVLQWRCDHTKLECEAQ